MPTIYEWIMPGSPDSPGGGGGGQGSIGTSGAARAGWIDLFVDPDTDDFVRTDDGLWQEISDASCAARLQLDAIGGAWWGDPQVGSRHHEIMADPGLGGIAEVGEAIRAALAVLAGDGMIEELRVTTDADETGRDVVIVEYFDRIAAKGADLAYRPFGEG